MDDKQELYTIFFDTLTAYKKKSIKVHIKKKNGRFYNGNILEVTKDHFILDDIMLGAMPIYFLEIEVLEKKERKE